jgi:hypothetical protein
MSDRRDVGAQRIATTEAEQLLARAAAIDASRASGTSIPELRDAALQAGISAEAFDAALQVGAGDAGAARVQPPFLVRLTMTGVPDRRTAAVFYWIFVVAMIAAPLVALVFPGPRTPWRLAGGFALSAFAFFSLWSTSYAMTWLDEHGWDLLRKKRDDPPR